MDTICSYIQDFVCPLRQSLIPGGEIEELHILYHLVYELEVVRQHKLETIMNT